MIESTIFIRNCRCRWWRATNKFLFGFTWAGWDGTEPLFWILRPREENGIQGGGLRDCNHSKTWFISSRLEGRQIDYLFFLGCIISSSGNDMRSLVKFIQVWASTTSRGAAMKQTKRRLKGGLLGQDKLRENFSIIL